MKILEREVVLKALVGSHNYGLANAESDRDYKVLIAPTFEELYQGKMFAKDIITETEDNSIHDIRKLPSLFFKSNINYLEVLESSELIIPSGNPEIEKIISLKKEIAKMNLPYFFSACRGMHLQKLSAIGKGTEGTQHLVDAYGYDTKQATHSYRCMKVVVDFEATNFEDFGSALRYSGEELDFILSMRHGELKREVCEKYIKHYYNSTFMHLEEKYKSFKPNLELKEELDELIMKLVKRKVVA